MEIVVMHTEKKYQTHKKWVENNREYVREKQRKYYHRNKARLAERIKELRAKWREERPEEYRKLRKNAQLKHDYGITLEQYDEMLKLQDGVCAICRLPETHIDPRTGKPYPLSVDHNHQNNMLRGLLCWRCNITIERIDKCGPNWVVAAGEYFKKYQ